MWEEKGVLCPRGDPVVENACSRVAAELCPSRLGAAGKAKCWGHACAALESTGSRMRARASRI